VCKNTSHGRQCATGQRCSIPRPVHVQTGISPTGHRKSDVPCHWAGARDPKNNADKNGTPSRMCTGDAHALSAEGVSYTHSCRPISKYAPTPPLPNLRQEGGRAAGRCSPHRLPTYASYRPITKRRQPGSKAAACTPTGPPAGSRGRGRCHQAASGAPRRGNPSLGAAGTKKHGKGGPGRKMSIPGIHAASRRWPHRQHA